jgi:TolB-like protein
MILNPVNRFLFVAILLLTATTIQAQVKTSIAVLPLGSNGISPSEALVLTDELLSVLVQSNVFTVVERGNMESILKEQGFQMSGCTSNECAVEAGKLLGVNKMVTGSVGKLGQIYNINLRLFDVETGEIEQNISQKHEGSIEGLLDVTTALGKKLSNYNPENSTDKITTSDQSSPFPSSRIGLWVGANFPQTSTLSSVNGGFAAGVFYKTRLASSLYIQPEISYAGSEIEIYEPDDILKLEYLQVAALFAYEISSANMNNFFMNLTAGPAVNLVLSAINDYEGYVSDEKSEVNSSGFLAVLGIGFGIKAGKMIITLDGRYESSFDTIYKDDIDREVGKLQAFYFLLGVAF